MYYNEQTTKIYVIQSLEYRIWLSIFDNLFISMTKMAR